ncbi:MAG: type III PLP-dependent enzyme [Pseudomonadota bacterium]|nr:type III PLP-dependent enzyme [Pseudomonadota bacterium]
MTDDLFEGALEPSVYNFSLSDDQIALQSAAPSYVDGEITDDYIRDLNPALPVPILHPHRLVKRTEEFVEAFTGNVMYAVKCNPDKIMLRAIYEGGVRRFDAASIAEIRLIRGLFPDAKIYFMHPIKAPEAIREAYVNHGVRAFVLDYAGELDKILHETNAAPDLELYVRMGVPKDTEDGGVATDFARKFGAKPDLAKELLAMCRPYCAKLGLSFHVGTQCSSPDIYSKAVSWAAYAIGASGVNVEALDVGGGFPAELNEASPIPPIQAFTNAIAKAINDYNLQDLELLCEVGRGLVACAGSLVVRVEGRKDDLLYLNDGTYGGIFEGGGSVGLPYPAHLIRRHEDGQQVALKAFRFAGPTCDSVDMMNGPFMLPENIQVGDWIRLEQLGAYGEVSRTDFNGFGAVQKIIVRAHRQQEDNLQLAQL